MAALSKVRRKYNQDDLVKAVDAVREKKMSLRVAAKCFSIPKSTLTDYSKKDNLN